MIDSISIYRALVGKSLSDEGWVRAGASDDDLRTLGIEFSNASFSQTRNPREQYPGSDIQVSGLPIFLLFELATGFAEAQEYRKGALPAVIQVILPYVLVENGSIRVFSNTMYQEQERELDAETLRTMQFRNQLNGEHFLLSDIPRLRDYSIVWRPNIMEKGRVNSSAGWRIAY